MQAHGGTIFKMTIFEQPCGCLKVTESRRSSVHMVHFEIELREKKMPRVQGSSESTNHAGR